MRIAIILLCLFGLAATAWSALDRRFDIEADILARSEAALAEAGGEETAIAVDGRDVEVTGIAADFEERQNIIGTFADVYGNRKVKDSLQIIPIADPFKFDAIKEASGDWSLIGFVPDTESKDAITSWAEGLAGRQVDAKLRVARGSPGSEWTPLVQRALEALDQTTKGNVQIRNNEVRLEGEIEDPKAQAALIKRLQAGAGEWTFALSKPDFRPVSEMTLVFDEDGGVSASGRAPADLSKTEIAMALGMTGNGAGIKGDLERGGAGDPGRWRERLDAIGDVRFDFWNATITMTDKEVDVSGELTPGADRTIVENTLRTGFGDALAGLDLVDAPSTEVAAADPDVTDTKDPDVPETGDDPQSGEDPETVDTPEEPEPSSETAEGQVDGSQAGEELAGELDGETPNSSSAPLAMNVPSSRPDAITVTSLEPPTEPAATTEGTAPDADSSASDSVAADAAGQPPAPGGDAAAPEIGAAPDQDLTEPGGASPLSAPQTSTELAELQTSVTITEPAEQPASSLEEEEPTVAGSLETAPAPPEAVTPAAPATTEAPAGGAEVSDGEAKLTEAPTAEAVTSETQSATAEIEGVVRQAARPSISGADPASGLSGPVVETDQVGIATGATGGEAAGLQGGIQIARLDPAIGAPGSGAGVEIGRPEEAPAADAEPVTETEEPQQADPPAPTAQTEAPLIDSMVREKADEALDEVVTGLANEADGTATEGAGASPIPAPKPDQQQVAAVTPEPEEQAETRTIQQRTFPVSSSRCAREADLHLFNRGLRFESGSARLAGSAEAVLDRLAGVANRCLSGGRLRLEIGGHTDNSGAASANRALSRARAQAIRRALAERGAPSGRMFTFGYGDSRPMADNATARGRALNRRITFGWVR